MLNKVGAVQQFAYRAVGIVSVSMKWNFGMRIIDIMSIIDIFIMSTIVVFIDGELTRPDTRHQSRGR